MNRDFEHIQRKMRTMKKGQIEYDHFDNGDPYAVQKGEPTDPTLLKGMNKPKKAKSIMDQSLDKLARADEE